MGEEHSPEEVLLAIGLANRPEGTERRVHPDRRSGLDRRRTRPAFPSERRSGGERRQVVRRKIDKEEGPSLLQKARNRLASRLRRSPETADHPHDGLR